MEIARYLHRIGLAGEPPATVASLARLQRQHLLHVPFENRDIRDGVPIPFHPAYFYRKIVEGGRGGYCYECNGLFHELLTGLGFHSRMISCRVVHGHHTGPEFDHMALIVTVEGEEWLADVGFGDFSLSPLRLGTDGGQADGLATYAVLPCADPRFASFQSACKWHPGKDAFLPKYIFSPVGHPLSDFAAMHRYQQTSPESHFTRNTITSIAVRDGRISLINNRLIITRGGRRLEYHLDTVADRQEALERYFGISGRQEGTEGELRMSAA